MARQSGTRKGAKTPETVAQPAEDKVEPGSDFARDVGQDAPVTPEAATEPEAPAPATPAPAPEGDGAPADPAPVDPPVEQTTAAPPASATETAAPPPITAPRRAGFAPLLLGGVLAAALGAGAALYVFPDGLGQNGAIDTELAALDARMAQALSQMESRLEDRLPADLAPEIASLAHRLNALEAAPGTEGLVQDLAAQLDAMEGRVSVLQPPADLEASVQAAAEAAIQAALETRIDAAISAALSETLSAQDDRAAQIEAAEAQLARNRDLFERRSALAELNAAAQSGAPAPDALERLSALGIETSALAALSSGLPTLAILQSGYAPAARAALAAAPLPDANDPVGRLTGFLRGVTNARSLAPREGEDTDAILSRAEALLRLGDLDGAIAEIDTLPEGPTMAMAEWRTMAEIRRDTLAALIAATADE
jgi:hypothetical protein